MIGNFSRCLIPGLVLALLCPIAESRSQSRRAASSPPFIDVENYSVRLNLNPDAHELEATSTITFRTGEATDVVLFELSENLSVHRVLNSEGIEQEFGRDESGPGILAIRFASVLPAGASQTIRVEYRGGYDRDRFSRMYSRDEASAYIGMEGTYLLYAAKWFPVNRFLVDRGTATIEITVPLGMAAVGPGTQLPVITQGITETFGWTAAQQVLPNSIVVGRYFHRKVDSGGFTVDCFVREENLDSVQRSAEKLGEILEYYQRSFGPSASGRHYRLVEVDDRLTDQHGMLGTVFITHQELKQSAPPVRELARRAAYQWWMETVGLQNAEDLWLAEGLSYYSAVTYLGRESGAALKSEIDSLAVLALKFENKSAVRAGLGLGYKTEAYLSVVAGKGAWILHMLRGLIGDPKFVQLLQEYVNKYAGDRASTPGFQKLAENIHGEDLGWFFSQWIDTIGVPTLETDYVVLKTREGFRVSGSLKQDRDLFRMPVDVEIVTAGDATRRTFDLDGKSTPFDISTHTMPKQVILDPDNKILRDSRELQVSVQLSLGDDLKKKGNLIEAIRAYENALKLNPIKSMAHFRLAEVFYEQFNLQAAADSFRDALNGDKDPQWIEVWCYIYLGKIYDILGQRQRAMAEYNKALNTKDDFNGAQAEAQNWLDAPFTRERTTMEVGPPD